MTEETLGRRLFGHGIIATLLLTLTLMIFSAAAMAPSTNLFISFLSTVFVVVLFFVILAGLSYGLARKWLEKQGKYTILLLSVVLIWLAVNLFNMMVAALMGGSIMDAFFMASQMTASLENWLIYLGGAFIYLLLIRLFDD